MNTIFYCDCGWRRMRRQRPRRRLSCRHGQQIHITCDSLHSRTAGQIARKLRLLKWCTSNWRRERQAPTKWWLRILLAAFFVVHSLHKCCAALRGNTNRAGNCDFIILFFFLLVNETNRLVICLIMIITSLRARCEMIANKSKTKLSEDAQLPGVSGKCSWNECLHICYCYDIKWTMGCNCAKGRSDHGRWTNRRESQIFAAPNGKNEKCRGRVWWICQKYTFPGIFLRIFLRDWGIEKSVILVDRIKTETSRYQQTFCENLLFPHIKQQICP